MKNSNEEEKESIEFNDIDTDERINIDVLKFDLDFPDPFEYSIGFIA